jgi:hypothetical protein
MKILNLTNDKTISEKDFIDSYFSDFSELDLTSADKGPWIDVFRDLWPKSFGSLFHTLLEKRYPFFPDDENSYSRHLSLVNTQLSVLNKIDKFSRERNLSYAAIKGIGLSYEIFKNPYCRQSGDIDIIVDQDSLSEFDFFIRTIGFKVKVFNRDLEPSIMDECPPDFLISMGPSKQIVNSYYATIDNTLIDLGLRTFITQLTPDNYFKFFLNRREVTINEFTFNILKREYLFISFCLDKYKDLSKGFGFKYRDFFDIICIIHSSTEPELNQLSLVLIRLGDNDANKIKAVVKVAIKLFPNILNESKINIMAGQYNDFDIFGYVDERLLDGCHALTTSYALNFNADKLSAQLNAFDKNKTARFELNTLPQNVILRNRLNLPLNLTVNFKDNAIQLSLVGPENIFSGLLTDFIIRIELLNLGRLLEYPKVIFSILYSNGIFSLFDKFPKENALETTLFTQHENSFFQTTIPLSQELLLKEKSKKIFGFNFYVRKPVFKFINSTKHLYTDFCTLENVLIEANEI